MDGWDDRYLAQCQFWFIKIILENGGVCWTEYLESTAVARGMDGVPGGYYRGGWRWSCLIDHRFLGFIRSVSPFPRGFKKSVFKKFSTKI
jgi:hypothetical protein